MAFLDIVTSKTGRKKLDEEPVKKTKKEDSDSANIEKDDVQKKESKLEQISNTGDTTEVQKEETEEIINQAIEKVVSYFTKENPLDMNSMERGVISEDEFFVKVEDYIQSLGYSEEADAKIYDSFKRFIKTYDIIDELIEDDTISDIKIYAYNHIRVKRLGRRESVKLKFRNPEHYRQFVEHTAIKNKVSIADMNAAQNFVDKKSSDVAILRFNITTKLINSSELPVIHIRKILKTKKSTEQLIKDGFFTQEQVDYLIDRIDSGDGFLIAGKGASGKTTLLNWLLDYIPDTYSGLVIQENEELFSNHPDMMFQHTVINRGEGKIEYTLRDLARNGLLTDLDWFIIGEIKGGEALYLLNAAYTGHKCIATIHGSSSTEAMNKLVDYIKYNSDYKKEEALEMLVHLNTVIFMKNYGIREISEVKGYNPETGKIDYIRVPLENPERERTLVNESEDDD